MKSTLKKNVYLSTVGGFNEGFKREKRFGNRVNLISRKFDEWKETIVDELLKNHGEPNDKKRLDGVAFTRFLHWMFVTQTRFKLIKKALPSNPNGDRSAKELLSEIKAGKGLRDLNLSTTERAELAELTTEHGGISVWRIMQVMYGIHKILLKDMGNGYTEKDLSEVKVLEYINKYHKQREAKAEQKQSDEAETEDSENEIDVIIEDVTGEFVEAETSVADILEMLENKEISAKDLELVPKIRAIREHASGWVKGQLTKRVNEIES